MPTQPSPPPSVVKELQWWSSSVPLSPTSQGRRPYPDCSRTVRGSWSPCQRLTRHGWEEGPEEEIPKVRSHALKRSCVRESTLFLWVYTWCQNHGIHPVVTRTASLTKGQIGHTKYDRTERRKSLAFWATELTEAKTGLPWDFLECEK